VQFHNCVIFGKGAETIAKWVTKGQELYVSGRIEYREWEKKDGGKGSATEIMVEEFQFGQKAKGAENKEVAPESSAPEGDDINPDDIPF
jgi:single-strand DNA-binding protein